MMPCWDDYRFFLAVAREGSLSAAARRLDVSQPTVSRRMEQLEADLGLRVLERKGSQLVVTPAGREVLGFIEGIERETAAIDRCLARRRSGPKPRVRLATTRGLATTWLVPRLAEFERSSAVRLDIHVALAFADLGHYQADVALRMGRPCDEALRGRRLAAVHCGLYASEAYLAKQGHPSGDPDLDDHLLIGSLGELAGLPQVRVFRERRAPLVAGVGVDCVSVQVALARHGHGLAVLPCFMAEAYPELQRVMRDAFDVPVELWALMNPDLRSDGAVREVFDFIVSSVQKEPSFFTGRD